MKTKSFTRFFWLFELLFFALGALNILFAWLGLIFFFTPLLFASLKGDKAYCNRYCGRGQLFALLGRKLSCNRPLPRFFRSKAFRYGFLAFFMLMFFNMVFLSVLVLVGRASLSPSLSLFWAFSVPWGGVVLPAVPPFFTQFALGFYGVMLTSNLLGLLTMALYKPRGFCVYCPMGTMTQGICQLKSKGAPPHG